MEIDRKFNKKALIFMLTILPLFVFAFAVIWQSGTLQAQLSDFAAYRLFGGFVVGIFSIVGASLSLNQHYEIEDDIAFSGIGIYLASLSASVISGTAVIARLPSITTFIAHGLLQALLVYFSVKMGVKSLKIVNAREHLIASILAFAVVAVVAAKLFFGSLFSLTYAELLVGSMALLSQALLPLIVILMVGFQPRLRRDPESLWGSLRSVMMPKSGYHYQVLLFYLFSVMSFLCLSCYFVSFDADHYELFPLSSVSIAWLPCFVFTVLNLRYDYIVSTTHKMLISMTSAKAIRFFLRYNESGRDRWAATVGLRTASFVIDHDPNNDAGKRLTATLSHIRRDEILRFAQKILSQQSLSVKAIGTQLLGTIDPEESSRPCVEVLRLFACVYLDVVPLVERRLKGLAALFPVIDPELAKMIQPHSIEESHGKMEWLYHLDFPWVDQQVILSKSDSMYGVTTESINTIENHQILARLQEKNRTGNFIWIGEKARERLAMEAPYLSNIIEAWTMEIDQSDHMVYLVKFEELIPRLQRYYSLEQARSLLRDFEINSESKSVLNMLTLQFSRKMSHQSIMDIVQSIASYNWSGFKEKDAALNGIVKAFHCMKSLLSEKSDQDRSLLEEEWRQVFLSAIEQIGYPSQLLHRAHKVKRSIRDLDLIIRLCQSPKNPRFAEAWLYVCSSDPQFYSHDDVMKFYALLKKVLVNSSLMKHELVRGKILEAFLNFAKKTTIGDIGILTEIYLDIARFMLVENRSLSAFSMLLDGKTYLEQLTNAKINIDSIKDRMESHLLNLSEESDQKFDSASVLGRWQSVTKNRNHEGKSA